MNSDNIIHGAGLPVHPSSDNNQLQVLHFCHQRLYLPVCRRVPVSGGCCSHSDFGQMLSEHEAVLGTGPLIR